MSWPLAQDYNEAIQSPRDNFSDPDLQGGEVHTNPMGLPLPCSGNFADVYQVRGPDGARWAVKCFTREVHGLRERYLEIGRRLRQARLPFTVDFSYLEQGIRVCGKWYPVLKMQWVEGQLLNHFVRDNLDKPARLGALAQIWLRLAPRLREAELAHADLQHGNVILVPGSTANALALKLIDYDGMWVPALADKPSGEVGHPNYQHPRRLLESAWRPEVDRFPLLVVAVALRGLALLGPKLWERYDNGDNLLFKETDLRAPTRSPLFKELAGVGDAETRALVEQLRQAVERPLQECPLLGPPPPRTPQPPTARAGPDAIPRGVAIPVALPVAGPSFDFSHEEERRRPRRRRTRQSRARAVAGLLLGAVTALGLVIGAIAWALNRQAGPPVGPKGPKKPIGRKVRPPVPRAKEIKPVGNTPQTVNRSRIAP